MQLRRPTALSGQGKAGFSWTAKVRSSVVWCAAGVAAGAGLYLVNAAYIRASQSSPPQVTACQGSCPEVVVYTGPAYGFDVPDQVAADSMHVWVTNTSGNSVTELNASNGTPVQILTGASYGFSRPYAIAVDRTRVWVTNTNGNSVTELNASNGSLMQVLAGSFFSGPSDVVIEGIHLWVTNTTGGSVTELTTK